MVSPAYVGQLKGSKQASTNPVTLFIFIPLGTFLFSAFADFCGAIFITKDF